MVRFLAHSDGSVLVPDEPVRLPKGDRFVVTVEPAGGESPATGSDADWFGRALELADAMQADLPEDLAEQHDHYIHGMPKQ